MDSGLKIGTLTYHRNQNYGGILQAYALQQAIMELGYQTEIIDYHCPGWKAMLDKREMPFSNHWKYNIKLIFQKILYNHALKIRYDRTMDFLNHFLYLSETKYENYAQLEKTFRIKQYHAVICGSDQIWNPSYKQADDAFYLRFVSEGLRIAYAGSFGVSNLSDSYITKRKQDFANFDYLSVREDAAIPLVAQMTEKPIYHVLDPTLLLTADQWSNLSMKAAKVELPAQYIIAYFLNDINNYASYLKKLSVIYNIPVVSIGHHLISSSKNIRQIADAGPLEFLNLLKNANAVVTDSFHGTVFSILFEKQFVCIPGSRGKMASRLYSMLSQLQLNNNIYETNMDGLKKTDYTKTLNILAEKRYYSRSFIVNSINNQSIFA
jgi:hypothetical protein